MRLNRQEAWLFVLPLIVLGLLGSITLWRHQNPTEVHSSIGFFEHQILQEQAAFKRLSMEIRKQPKANVYKILSSDPHLPERPVLVYTRHDYETNQKGILKVDHRFCDYLSSGVRAIENALDEDIHRVAQQNGTFIDLPMRFWNGVVRKMNTEAVSQRQRLKPKRNRAENKQTGKE